MNRIKRLYERYPVIGLRTIKTVIAVMLSSLFMQHVLHLNPFFACIGAFVAMERTMERSVQAAIIRNVGTITGGLLGIAIASVTENTFLMALGLIPFIWINNAVGKKESIVPGAIVYFAVFFLNSMSEAWSYGLLRILGTLIGSIIALMVNALLLPREEPTLEGIPDERAEEGPCETAPR